MWLPASAPHRHGRPFDAYSLALLLIWSQQLAANFGSSPESSPRFYGPKNTAKHRLGSDSGCDFVYDGYCYGIENYEKKTFNAAAIACSSVGASLAKVPNVLVNNYIRLHSIYESMPIWIGLTDQSEEGDWTWIHDGSHVTFSLFNSNDFVLGDGYYDDTFLYEELDCTAMEIQDGVIQWGTWDCDTQEWPYVCMWEGPAAKGRGASRAAALAAPALALGATGALAGGAALLCLGTLVCSRASRSGRRNRRSNVLEPECCRAMSALGQSFGASQRTLLHSMTLSSKPDPSVVFCGRRMRAKRNTSSASSVAPLESGDVSQLDSEDCHSFTSQKWSEAKSSGAGLRRGSAPHCNIGSGRVAGGGREAQASQQRARKILERQAESSESDNSRSPPPQSPLPAGGSLRRQLSEGNKKAKATKLIWGKGNNRAQVHRSQNQEPVSPGCWGGSKAELNGVVHGWEGPAASMNRGNTPPPSSLQGSHHGGPKHVAPVSAEDLPWHKILPPGENRNVPPPASLEGSGQGQHQQAPLAPLLSPADMPWHQLMKQTSQRAQPPPPTSLESSRQGQQQHGQTFALSPEDLPWHKLMNETSHKSNAPPPASLETSHQGQQQEAQTFELSPADLPWHKLMKQSSQKSHAPPPTSLEGSHQGPPQNPQTSMLSPADLPWHKLMNEGPKSHAPPPASLEGSRQGQTSRTSMMSPADLPWHKLLNEQLQSQPNPPASLEGSHHGQQQQQAQPSFLSAADLPWNISSSQGRHSTPRCTPRSVEESYSNHAMLSPCWEEVVDQPPPCPVQPFTKLS